MRAFMMVAACVVCCAGVASADQTGERELFDKSTGVAVTLPEGWAFFVDKCPGCGLRFAFEPNGETRITPAFPFHRAWHQEACKRCGRTRWKKGIVD